MAQTLESACNAGDPGSVPIARGAWRATVHGVAKSQTQPSDHFHFQRGGMVG